jgi:hypothetical protein
MVTGPNNLFMGAVLVQRTFEHLDKSQICVNKYKFCKIGAYKKKTSQMKDRDLCTGRAFIPYQNILAKEVWHHFLAKMGGNEGKDDAEEEK